MSPTFHGNLLLGPTSRSPQDRHLTNEEVLTQIVTTARKSVDCFDLREVITSYSGLRAKAKSRDFIVEESKQVPAFINVAGIDSPGLTSSPAVAKMVVDEIIRPSASRFRFIMERSPKFNPYREPIIHKKGRDWPGAVGDSDPKHNVVCRCERVTEAEIVDSIHRKLPVRTTDAVKKRTRAGMGPCQGSFCERRVAAIVSRELGIPLNEVKRRGRGSSILSHRRITASDRKFLSKL